MFSQVHPAMSSVNVHDQRVEQRAALRDAIQHDHLGPTLAMQPKWPIDDRQQELARAGSAEKPDDVIRIS